MKRLGLALLLCLPVLLLAQQNNAPVVQNPLADFAIEEDSLDTSINLNDVFYDADFDDLFFEASGNNHIGVTINNGFVSLMPAANWNGAESITFEAMDPFGGSASDTVIITVLGVNDAPEVFNPMQNYSLAYNGTSSGLDLLQVFRDVDSPYGDVLSFANSGSNHINVAITGSIVTLSVDWNWFGTENVTFTATDNDGATAQHIMAINVTSPSIANVSVSPNPFSPDFDGQKDQTAISWYLSGNGVVTVQITDELSVPVFVEDVEATSGWNQFFWDGYSNVGVHNGTIVPDGSYGLNLYCGTASYEISFTIKVDTAPPVIDLLASFPNPFSPNNDGYQDFHQVRFRVDDTIIRYIGLIRVNLYRESNDPGYIATNFVEEDCTDPFNITVTNPDISVFNELTDGGYLFVIRSTDLSLGHEITLSSGARYDLIVGGNGSSEHNMVEVGTGQSMYKIGHVQHPYFTVNGVGSDDHEEDNEDNIQGYDYLRLFVMEGNASFNIYEDVGAPYMLTDLFPIYYGAVQNLIHPVFGTPMFSDFQYNITIPGSIDIPETIMSDGRYIWRTIITDQASHAAEESGELLVNNYPVEVISTVEPPQMSPGNQDGYFDQAIVQYQVSEHSYVTIKVWDDTQTSVVRSLVDADDTPESGYVIWDGTDNDGNPVSDETQSPYIVEVTAQDVNISEDVVSDHIPILVDNIGPEAPEIFLPGGQAYVETPQVNLGGISNDIGSDVLLYLNSVYQGNVATTPTYPGYFSFPVTLEEGYNEIWVKLRDQAYNVGDSSNVVSVNLDSSSPVIDVVYPPADTLFRVDTFRVRASVSDLEGIGVDPATVKFGFSLFGNNTSWRHAQHVPNSNTYYYDYEVGVGIEQLDIDMWVEANDLLGNFGITPDSVRFYYQAVIPPEVLSHNPADSTIVRQLPDGHVTSLIYDNEGQGLNFDDSRIWLVNPSGVVLNGSKAISNAGEDLYEITFAPSEEMPDGWYEYITFVTDNYAGGGSVDSDTTAFLLDNTSPTVANTVVGNDAFTTPISDGMIINHSIEYISIDVSDLNDVNFGTSYVHLFNSQNNALDGVKSVNGNTITWTLDNELLVNEQNSGGYSVRYSAYDIAGNQTSGRIDFTLASTNAPQVTVRYPARNSYISALTGQSLSITFNEAVGVSTNIADTYLKLHLPNGNVLQHGAGATQSIDASNPPQYVMTLELDDALSQVGTYEVELRIENLNNIPFAEVYYFTFDDIPPVIESFRLGLEDETSTTIFGGEEMEQAVLWGQSTLGDNFAVDLDASQVKIFTDDGEPVAGEQTQLAGSRLRWALSEPLSAINGHYYLRTELHDMAGNTVVDSVHFSISTIVTRFTPADGAFVGQSLSQIKVELVRVSQDEIVPGGTWLVLTHPDGTLIGDPDLPGGGVGAQVHFAYSDTLTTISLDLDNALSANGADDGSYGALLHLALPENNSIPIEFGFVYDRTKPTYTNLRLNEEPVAAREGNFALAQANAPRVTLHGSAGNRTSRGWLRADYYAGRIDSISVEFADATSGVSPSPNMTYLFLADAGETPVAGTKVVSGSTYRWVLNNPIVPGQDPDGVYNIVLKVTDRAGNTREHTESFTFISDPTPELDDWLPWGMDYTYVNTNSFAPPEFQATFKDHFGLVEDYDETYIRIHYPSGDSVYHPHGGDLVYTDTDSSYVVAFTLDGSLHTDGADDGLYTIDVKATNNVGAVYREQQWMMYDTVVPYPVEVAIIDNAGSVHVVGDSLEANNGIASLRVKYGDETSGLYYVPHLTKVSLFDQYGTIVPGAHAYGEWVEQDSLVFWNLEVPLANDGSDDGYYTIHLRATDKAGNVYAAQVPVTVFSPMTPTDFAWTLDALWQVHLTWEHYVPGGSTQSTRKQIGSRYNPVDDMRDLQYYILQRRVNGNDWQTLAYPASTSYTDDLLEQPDGSYEYRLYASYTAGLSDPLMTSPIDVKRFAAVTVQVTEEGGTVPIDSVRVHLKGNDGLYDQEFEGYTGVDGRVSFAGVFMDIYQVNLSKTGYTTTTYHATVDEDPETLTFTLNDGTGTLASQPHQTKLLQNVPNPFNPITEVRLALHEDSHVTVTIYNVKGQRVRLLADEQRDAGWHNILWNGRADNDHAVASGIYFCLLETKGATSETRDMRKMILMK